jgi:hypothetical protein
MHQIKEAKDKGDNKSARDVEQRYLFDMREFADIRLHWDQQKLIRKARRLYISVPRQDMKKIEEEFEDDNWYYSRETGEMLLKAHVMTNLRNEVVNEKRQQRATRATWATWVTALATGFLAVVTWQYVSLTNRLVRLQIEPSVEAGLRSPSWVRRLLLSRTAVLNRLRMSLSISDAFCFVTQMTANPQFSLLAFLRIKNVLGGK